MNCPNCGSLMEGENSPVIVGNSIELEYKGKVILKEAAAVVPSGHYRCDNCDSEWVWYKRKSRIRQLDGPDLGREDAKGTADDDN